METEDVTEQKKKEKRKKVGLDWARKGIRMGILTSSFFLSFSLSFYLYLFVSKTLQRKGDRGQRERYTQTE